MNLDSLSFTLSQISYLVANLSKKNFEDSCQEISVVSINARTTNFFLGIYPPPICPFLTFASFPPTPRAFRKFSVSFLSSTPFALLLLAIRNRGTKRRARVYLSRLVHRRSRQYIWHKHRYTRTRSNVEIV